MSIKMDVWDYSYFKAAVNTIRASRWELFKARWLGERLEATEDSHRVIGCRYKGKFYLTDYTGPNESWT